MLLKSGFFCDLRAVDWRNGIINYAPNPPINAGVSQFACRGRCGLEWRLLLWQPCRSQRDSDFRSTASMCRSSKLRGLLKLRQLWLAGTETTPTGVAELERWLQGMEVYR
jgi:hypothetical protein